MKKNNLWRVIWIVGIYAVLVSVLYLVIMYKVKWEHKDLNKYLYFYNCSEQLCASDSVQEDYYSKVLCEDDKCPYIKEINENILVLSRDNKSWLYDYIEGYVVNNGYIDYRYIGNDNYVVTNNFNKQGVINIKGEILVNFDYDYIKDYNNGYINYRVNNFYGVSNSDCYVSIEPKYNDIILIDDKIFAYKEGNSYFISYYNGTLLNDKRYEYVYSYKNAIFTIHDKKIDILDNNLNSLLLMKLNTFYEYDEVGEVNSLKIHHDENNIYFTLYDDSDNYTEYVYDIINNKLN